MKIDHRGKFSLCFYALQHCCTLCSCSTNTAVVRKITKCINTVFTLFLHFPTLLRRNYDYETLSFLLTTVCCSLAYVHMYVHIFLFV